MTPATWELLVGALLILMALSGTLLRTLPVSAALLYMGIGFAIGPSAFGWLDLGISRDAAVVEAISEVTVLISLFAVACACECSPSSPNGKCLCCSPAWRW